MEKKKKRKRKERETNVRSLVLEPGRKIFSRRRGWRRLTTEDQWARFFFTGDSVFELLADRLVKEALCLPHVDQLEDQIKKSVLV